MHFCHEELFAIMAAIPAAGFVLNWLRAKLHRRRACECPNAGARPRITSATSALDSESGDDSTISPRRS
jgi:hypothetical protein